MAHLYPRLRIHQVFGANTDVGKTIFTTALCLASHSTGEKVHYLKPVSTGNLDDSDDAHVSRYAPETAYKTLYRFGEAVSPHLAVELERRAALAEREVGGAPAPPTDADFVRETGRWLHAAVAQQPDAQGVAYVETAGGVHSPGPSGTSQAQLLRPLRMPTILIGSSELGGISTTRSAFESLLYNGYDVEAVLLFPSPRYGNVEYLTKFFQQEHGIPVWGLGGPNGQGWGAPPVRQVDTQADQQAMREFYAGLVRGASPDAEPSAEHTPGGVSSVVSHLQQRHLARIRDLSTLASRTRDTCWWPFTQHTLTPDDRSVNVIDSAYGDFFVSLDQREGRGANLLQPLLDGSASWWTQCLGHAPQRLVQAAAKAGSRFGHVLFPVGAYAPALHLSEQLVGKTDGKKEVPLAKLEDHPGAGWADRVFFSDDGSTGMEVAIKMAVQSSICRYASDLPSSEAAGKRAEKGHQPGYQSGRPKREWEVLGLKGSYHGDTIGAMDACEPSIYSKAVDWYRGRGFWFEPPSVHTKAGQVTISVTGDGESVFKRNPTLPGRGDKAFEVGFASMAEAYDVEARLSSPLAEYYRRTVRAQLERLVVQEGRRFGALVLEPLVMGAGGMIFVDPLFQRVLIDVVRSSEDLFSLTDAPLRHSHTPTHYTSRPASGRDPQEWQGLPVIFDEVFTGLYRLGHASNAPLLGATPDISCLAKILTGGMVPMSVTLASRSVFETFKGEEKVQALLHGHSYTAHPIGCEVALETLRAIGEMKQGPAWKAAKAEWSQGPVWSFWSPEAVEEISALKGVDHVIAMGCVLKISLEGESGYASTASVDLLAKLKNLPSVLQGHPAVPTEQQPGQLPFNIHARPLGNVVYFMSSLNTPASVLRATERIVADAIKHA